MSETKQGTFKGTAVTVTVSGSNWTITGEGVNESGDSFFTLAKMIEDKDLVLPSGGRRTRRNRRKYGKSRRHRK